MKYVLLTIAFLMFCLASVISLDANELVRGKVVEATQKHLTIRLPSGNKEEIYLNSDTKIMHKAGSGEQSAPPRLAKNAKVAVSLDGRTAVFVVLEEVPK